MKSLKAKLVKVAKVALMSGLVLGAMGCVSQAQLDKMNSDIKGEIQKSQDQFDSKIATIVEKTICTENNGVWNETSNACDKPSSGNGGNLGVCLDLPVPAGYKDVVLEGLSEKDDVFYGDSITLEADNSDVKKLFVGKVEFDGKEYNVEETYKYDSTKARIATSLDDKEYQSPVLVLEEGAFIYDLLVDADLPISDIDDDEILDLVFAGQKFRVTNADADSITFTTEKKVVLEKNQCYKFGNNEIKLTGINVNSVSVMVNGESDVVYSVKKIGGIEVGLIEGFPDDKNAMLSIGEDITSTVEDGDPFELVQEYKDADKAPWKWSIIQDAEGYHINLVSNLRYIYIDEDENAPLKVDEVISLPFNYLSTGMTGIDKVDAYEYELTARDGFIEMKGPDNGFVLGGGKFEKIKTDGVRFYEMDDTPIADADGKVVLAKSAWTLDASSTMVLDNFEFVFDLTSTPNKVTSVKIDKNGDLTYETDLSDRAENLLNYNAIELIKPEYSFDHGKVRFSVTKTRPKVTLEIKG